MSKLEEMSFDVDCDWDGLKKILDEAPKTMEYIEYKGEKWIKEDFCIPKQYIKDKIKDLDFAIAFCGNEDRMRRLMSEKNILEELLEGK